MGYEHTGGATATDGTPTVHLKKKVKLLLYPGEEVRANGVTYGHIYVVGGKGESYEVAAGPPPGKGRKDNGGHTAGETPAGKYVLSAKEHHITVNWPMSSIPWGAALQEKDGEVYYTIDGGKPKKITGKDGVMTKAAGLFYDRTYDGWPPDKQKMVDKEVQRKQFIDRCYAALYDSPGVLSATWLKNDFGKWAWNLTKGGSRTAYYFHTTPDEELGTSSALDQSHGCVHLWPKDRDDMMSKGYLEKGTEVEVKKYGETKS